MYVNGQRWNSEGETAETSCTIHWNNGMDMQQFLLWLPAVRLVYEVASLMNTNICFQLTV